MNWQKLEEVLKNDQYFYASLNKINKSTANNLQTSEIPVYLQRSVTQRIDEIKQPKGNYLPIKSFTEQKLINDGIVLEYKSSEDARKFASSLGLVVDYISRYLYSKDIIESFFISFLSIYKYLSSSQYTTHSFSDDECLSLYQDFKQKLYSIEKLDVSNINQESIDIIKNIFVIVQLDGIYRAGYEPEKLWEKTTSGIKLIFNNNQEIPNYICTNALICIRRTLAFFNSQQEIIFGECFGNGKLISTGDCDFISQDTIWDMKVSSVNIYKNSKANKWTLQILIYYLMLKHHTHHNFSKYTNVKNVGIFNPYLNVCYTLQVDKFVNNDYIKEIENEIIGFDWKMSDGYRLDNQKHSHLIVQLLKHDFPDIKIYSRYINKE